MTISRRQCKNVQFIGCAGYISVFAFSIRVIVSYINASYISVFASLFSIGASYISACTFTSYVSVSAN